MIVTWSTVELVCMKLSGYVQTLSFELHKYDKIQTKLSQALKILKLE